MNAVLEIGTWSSRCGACSKSANPHEETHTTVLGYGGPHPPGCGVRWTHVQATYTGMDDRVAALRPDLELIPMPEGFG